jgi:hypothetical protein
MRTLTLTLVLAFSVACNRDPAPASDSNQAPAAALAPFLLTAEPAAAVTVDAAKPGLKAGDAVVLHGRVQDFVEGLGAFTLVDPSLPACGEKSGVADSCETPWDYCCEPDLPSHLVTVELRGADGKVIAASLMGHAGFAHLKHAIVVGTADVDPRGNVTIAASGVYLRS